MSLAWKSAFQFWKVGLTLFVLYFFTAKFSLKLATAYLHSSPIWPPSGIAIASLFLLGKKYWPFILAAACLSNYSGSVGLATAFGIGVGNMLEAVLGAWLMKRIRPGIRDSLDEHLVISLLACVFLAAPISASFGSFSLHLAGLIPWHDLRHAWVTWWTGNAIGMFLITPWIISIHEKKWGTWNPTRITQYLLFLATISILGYSVFSFSAERIEALILIYPALLWGAIRFQTAESSFVLLVLTGIAIGQTASGTGPFSTGNFNSNMLWLQLFIASLAISDMSFQFMKRNSNMRMPSIVLVLSWMVTGVILYSFSQKEKDLDRSHFENLVGEMSLKIQERISIYENVLKGAKGILLAEEKIDRKDWASYIEALQIQTHFPGMFGVGVIHPVAEADLGRFTSKMKQWVSPNYTIKQLEPGSHREHFVISILEPYETNSKAVGLNVGSEPIRRRYLELARQSGQTTMTAPIYLIQDGVKRQAFAVYLPVFNRDQSFRAWVFMPLTLEPFLDHILSASSPELGVEISMKADEKTLSLIQLRVPQIHRIQQATEMKLWGHTLKLQWHATSQFLTRKDTTVAWIVFVCLIVSLLFASIVALFENISERAGQIASRRTAELHAQNQLWSSLTSSAPIGIFQANEEGKKTFVNERWLEFICSTPSRCLGKEWWLAFDLADQENLKLHWNRLKNGEIETYQAQLRLAEIKKTFAFVIRRVDSTPITFVGTIQDVTEMYEEQVQLMKASRMSTVGEMAAGVAHEINNPLSIIDGRTQLVIRQVEEFPKHREQIVDSLKIIRQTTERIAKIVRGLKVFSRSGEDDDFLECGLPSIVETTLDFCSERFRKANVELQVSQVPEVGLVCRDVQVSQVLLNLLNNAFDAVAPLGEKWVRVQVAATPDEVQFRVTDSGRGIDPQVVEKIMQPFFTTKPVGQGTGLGLSISRGIAESHQGSLRVDESSPNTCFVFTVSRHLKAKSTLA